MSAWGQKRSFPLARQLTPPFRPFTATAAPTAYGPYAFVPIFLTVVVAELFSCSNILLSHDEYTVLPFIFHWLAVRCTGVVDVSSDIFSPFAIYGYVVALQRKKVFAAAAPHFCFGDDRPPVFGHNRTSFNRSCRKQTKAMRSTLHSCIFVYQSLHKTTCELACRVRSAWHPKTRLRAWRIFVFRKILLCRSRSEWLTGCRFALVSRRPMSALGQKRSFEDWLMRRCATPRISPPTPQNFVTHQPHLDGSQPMQSLA